MYSLGDGKKRREADIVIPADLSASEVVTFVADIYHELATPENSEVKVLDDACARAGDGLSIK